MVRLLVERGDIEVDSKDIYRQTPMLWAAKNGHEAVVQLLLERKDVAANSKSASGQTPLLRAAENGHEAVVRLLLEREDIEVDLKDGVGKTAMDWAIMLGHEEVVRLLGSKDSTITSRSKLSYGVIYKEPYRHPSMISSAHLATDPIDWFIYKGQIKREEYSHRFSRIYTNEEPNRKWEDMVVAAECYGYNAPDSLWDEKVKLVCIIESTLPDLGSDTTDVKVKHKAWSTAGETTGYKNIFYEIKLVFKNSDPNVEVWSKGQKIGSSEVKWKGESGQYFEKRAGRLEGPMKVRLEEEALLCKKDVWESIFQ